LESTREVNDQRRPKATFVLVHGAFHGGWCYEQVARQLRAQGHDVYAPTLSGVGERAHLAAQAINLSTQIQDVVALIEANDLRDVILCGHSYGGMVITGVADRVGERIRTLFYLDACVPENGQSMFDLIGPARTLASLGLAGATGTMMPPFSAGVFKVKAENQARVDRLCTPHPIACFVEKLRLTGKEKEVRNRTFVLAELYDSINHPTYARVNALPGWKTVSLRTGHDVMVDEPDLLTALLLEEVER